MERRPMKGLLSGKSLLSGAHPQRRSSDRGLLVRLVRLREELGPMGLGALGLLAAAFVFNALVVEPIQIRNRQLESSLARQTGRAAPGASSAASGKLEDFYAHLGTAEAPTDWLAKLYGIGKATGVELQSGSYRMASGANARAEAGAEKAGAERASADKGAAGRIERYEIVLPVAGSYPQLREFLKRALAEIPVLSLDQLTLKRESREDGAVRAELKMTLHLVKP
jgi:hypothetical protein